MKKKTQKLREIKKMKLKKKMKSELSIDLSKTNIEAIIKSPVCSVSYLNFDCRRLSVSKMSLTIIMKIFKIIIIIISSKLYLAHPG